MMNKIFLSKGQSARMARIVRKLRRDQALTQLELSQKVTGFEISHCFVSRVERAKLNAIPKERIQLLAQELGVEPDYLIGNVYSSMESLDSAGIQVVIEVADQLKSGQIAPRKLSQLLRQAA